MSNELHFVQGASYVMIEPEWLGEEVKWFNFTSLHFKTIDTR